MIDRMTDTKLVYFGCHTFLVIILFWLSYFIVYPTAQVLTTFYVTVSALSWSKFVKDVFIAYDKAAVLL